MKKFLFPAAMCLALLGCSSNAQTGPYTVTISDSGNLLDGDIVYLYNYDTSEKVDSATVADNQVVFKGVVEGAPFMARAISEGNRLGMFIVEPGDITFTDGEITGGKLNDRFKDFRTKAAELEGLARSVATKEAYDSLVQRYNDLYNKSIADNADNTLGMALFNDMIQGMERAELDSMLNVYPQMRDSKRVQKAIEFLDRKDATAPGKMFADFKIEYNGETHKLSDYVGNGKYTLVDFWASWCGPCRREASTTLKQLYEENKDNENFQIVGIAVWDEPENTLRAIEEMQLPWEQVINGQNIPTDLYGILGIPCIILFGPDGTIISRDLQGADLVNSVNEALATK